MKRCIATLAPLALVVLLVGLTGCEGDQGPAGADGVGLETCMGCHTDDYTMEGYIVAIQTEYSVSKHSNAETFVRRGSEESPDCARCHTTEGYQHFVTTGTPQEVLSSSPIGCFACHSPHTSGDFMLRKTGATPLERGGNYDKGTSNTCAMCHQARTPGPDITDTETAIASRYWGPHHGPQGSVVAGTGAHVFTDPYASDSTHNTGITSGCVGCHMAEVAQDGLAGGHSFGMLFTYHGSEETNSKGCTMAGCHTTWVDDEDGPDAAAHAAVEAAKAAFTTDIEALRDDLLTLEWLSDASHINPGGVPADQDARGAVYNYLMLLEDRSGGVHNPTYAKAALAATQTYVTSQLPQ